MLFSYRLYALCYTYDGERKTCNVPLHLEIPSFFLYYESSEFIFNSHYNKD